MWCMTRTASLLQQKSTEVLEAIKQLRLAKFLVSYLNSDPNFFFFFFWELFLDPMLIVFFGKLAISLCSMYKPDSTIRPELLE